MTFFTDSSMSLTSRSGTLVERYLFSPLYSPRSAWAVVGWWERRRLFYNVVVGAAGLFTSCIAVGVALLTGHEGPPPGAILVYGIAANLFYSLGTPIHLFLRRWLKTEAGPVAQALFRYGLAFSIGLTLLPIPFLLLEGILSIFNP